ncbi:DUF6458 family protein [Krasilnikovia sp. M28-CT-15]|uniref:DUF6458 family protein n=1 Tax=Krasilnikovia sp. M28-CT-15 TaxID=3373540 RepID=UPI003876667F
MGIGGSIFLLALGAILAFAVNADISGLDLNVVGWVLMAAGLVGLIVTIWYWNSRRRAVVVNQARPGVVGGGTVTEYRETRRDDVPPPPPPGY